MRPTIFLLLGVLLLAPSNSGAQELNIMPGGVVLPHQIPDCYPAGITSHQSTTGCDFIEDVNVSLVIEHGWIGDLVVSLTSPSGTEVTLVDRPGLDGSGYGCQFAGLQAVLDDAASLPLESQCEDDNGGSVSAISGTLSPNEPLNAFNGELGSGIWTLRVSDWAEQNSGRLVSWNLDLTCSSIDVDLQSELSVNRQRAMPGDTIILSLRVLNSGSEGATGIVVEYALPDGLQAEWAEPGALADDGFIVQRFGSMAPAEATHASLGIRVNDGQWGWQNVGVDVRSEQTDRTPDNNRTNTRIFIGLGRQE